MQKFLTCHLCNTTIISGEKSVYELLTFLKEEHIDHPLIITDQQIAQFDFFKSIVQKLDTVKLYDRVTPNPKDYEVMDAVRIYKKSKCDGVIGIGGGSSMDAAKAVSAMVRHEGFIMDYGRSTPNRKYFSNGREKLILVPTTCGTGSEVSPHAVITNTSKHRKSDIQEKLFYPDYVILDADLLKSLPEKVAKDTGIDALCHAIEVYTSKHSMEQFAPLHTEAALKAIQLIASNLREMLASADNSKAREHMQWAAMLAGFSLDLDATIGHGLAGQLQKYHENMTHGESVGVLLLSILEYNMDACPDRMRDIALAFHQDIENCTEREISEKAVQAVRT